MEILTVVLGSNVLTALIAMFSAWQLRGRHDVRAGIIENGGSERGARDPRRDELAAELEVERKKVATLEKQLTQATERLRGLEKCRRVLTVQQPVLLLGPRNVGKTSLVKLWHSPWHTPTHAATERHQQCLVPVIEWDEPSPADVENRPRIRRVLKLKCHDFPGEMSQQKEIARTVREEAGELRAKYPEAPGVVIVCLFNAEEVHTGITPATAKYYNGDLFRELKTLYAMGSINIERVVLVFNKIDLLRRHFSHGTTSGEILDVCLKMFATVCAPIFGLVHPDRVCEVMTVLGSADEHRKSEGAEVVKGEAARPLVEMFGGAAIGDRVAPERASQRAGAVMGGL